MIDSNPTISVIIINAKALIKKQIADGGEREGEGKKERSNYILRIETSL